jgi:transposase
LEIPVNDPPTSANAPSYEELTLQVVSLSALVAEQAKTIEKLGLEIVELRARLGMNSRNSSKPPSSDGYEKPAPKSRRLRSGKKPGKQPGDPGHHLAQRADPDATTIHRPDNCEKCGKDLSDAEVSGVITRQVFDLPPVALFCTEHQAERRRCSCGAETTGTFPSEATAPACYGPALRAYVCYLVTRQHIPVARVAEQLRDAYGAPISTATIISMVKEGAAMLEEFLAHVRDLLRDADVVHADETGLRVEAALAWVHAVSTGELTLYHLDKKRGTDAMDAMGVIEHLRGVLVHDGWSSYRSYENLTHQLCNAHHLRELEAAGSTEGQSWATDMATLLSATWQLVLEARAAGQRSLSDQVLAEVCESYKGIIAAGHVANPPVAPSGRRGRTKRSMAHNLLLRLDAYEDDVLRFATDFAVPFDNNLCERDVRMVKIAQKISGGFRSTEGAEAFLALRSYLSTAAKQGMNRLEALQRLFNGDTWMPAAPGARP